MSTLPLFGDRKGDKPGNGDDTRVYRVAQLNRMVRGLLEQRWAEVWVAGEISDMTLAASGHAYFTLNDEQEAAQLRVVLFKTELRRSKARLENGARVKLLGQLSLFTPRGTYQLIARLALPEGLGELHAQFERTRKKLEAEGLLAPERKRRLPRLPRVLGVVTSRDGAALHDIVRVANKRCPVRIVVAPCVVQGNDAPRSIVNALRLIQLLRGLDAVIVGRGGGAAEDLIAFNDERVARAIAGCRVPTISAVGHEVDITIADLVADLRAATPSNAAELAVPDRRALAAELANVERALARAAEVRIGRARLRLERATQRLRDPRHLLRDARAPLAHGQRRLQLLLAQRLRRERSLLTQLSDRLARCDPRLLLAQQRERLIRLHSRLLGLGPPIASEPRGQLLQLQGRLFALARPIASEPRGQLLQQAARLHALSPLGILARGYAIALHEASGAALLRADQAAAGDMLQVRLHEGTLRARVEKA
jgi:exodeoxyribonuclease VII large subunit